MTLAARSAVHSTSCHSGAPPCVRQYFESCENATYTTSFEPRSGYESILRRRSDCASYRFTTPRSERSAIARNLRLLVTPSAVMPSDTSGGWCIPWISCCSRVSELYSTALCPHG